MSQLGAPGVACVPALLTTTAPGLSPGQFAAASCNVTSKAGDRQMFIVHTVRMRNGVAESNPAAAIASSRSGMGDNGCKSDAAFESA